MASLTPLLIGYPAFVGMACLLSEHRRHVPRRTVAGGVALQGLAVAILKSPALQAGFAALTTSSSSCRTPGPAPQ